ncbi:glycosyltransferase [Acidobacterium sp. S8]|uniref:glycosyltransferase n=1 Tax=Acidobacterium sp. S8 TaxID=1641854 RepID=UPI00131E2334|nr:glycosyltransferase [Acidobacterium sp. S8]
MRILHVLPSLDPTTGGPAEGMRRLAEGYLHAGHEVEITTLDDPRAPFLASLPFPVWPQGPAFGVYGYTPRLLPWLRQNASRFDGIVVNGLWQYHGLAAWRAFHGRHRYAVFTHGMLDPWFKAKYPLKHMKKWIYWLLVEYRLLRNATRVLFTSEAEQRLAEKSFWLHHWHGQVVPYGTSGPTGDPGIQREEFLRLCPALAGKRFLLFLGRIHPKKGCDLLIDAFAQAASNNAGLQLVVAGPDQKGWRVKLEARAQQLSVGHRIHWPGMLSGDAKWGAFYEADAFILPSHQENFGIAVAEALACGLPVLMSDKVNIFAEVQEDGAGLVESDTLEGTISLIRCWLALSEVDRIRMRANAKQSFESRYNSMLLPDTISSIFNQPVNRESSEINY